MRRTSFSIAEMIRTMLVVTALFVAFATSVHVVSHGLATPAFAGAESGVGLIQKKSNGIGFVLMVSLQRA